MISFWIWTIISFLVIIWYIFVTIIVSFKGGKDIRQMLESLREEDDTGLQQ